MPREIERRFILSHLPPGFVLHPSYYTQQAYVLIDEAAQIEERVRYRLTPDDNATYQRCRKQGSGRSCDETEAPISAMEFAQGLVNRIGNQIIKRVFYELYDLRWIEFHIFMSHRPLMMIEVEFKSEEDAAAFQPPDWFGPEVTNDRRYNNASIALNGVPSDFSTTNEMLMLFHGEVLPIKPSGATQ